MSASTQARQAELDGVLDSQQVSPGLAEELFSVVELLGGQVSLRNALSDSTAGDPARRQLATGLFASRVSGATQAVLEAAAGLRWSSGADLVAALERQGVRALLRDAQLAGRLDRVEEELFRFSRIVAGNQGLRELLEDRTASRTGREEVVTSC